MDYQVSCTVVALDDNTFFFRYTTMAKRWQILEENICVAQELQLSQKM